MHTRAENKCTVHYEGKIFTGDLRYRDMPFGAPNGGIIAYGEDNRSQPNHIRNRYTSDGFPEYSFER